MEARCDWQTKKSTSQLQICMKTKLAYLVLVKTFFMSDGKYKKTECLRKYDVRES
jgi:hypothetical protein